MISVIVPVYNVERYMAKCIESVIAQTFTNWELILVDDGSSDDSLAICNRYAEQDDRITVVHQENQGVSSARNRGIDIAKGEYISFIDSDDYVTPTYLSDMVNHNSDVVASGFTLWYAADNRNEIKTFHQQATFSRENGNIADAIEIGESNHLWKGPCTKLFRKALIDKHNIRFDETISYGEDHLFVISVLMKCQTITLLSISNYIYTHYGNMSLTNRIIPYDAMFRYIAKIDDLRQKLIEGYNLQLSSYAQFCDNELSRYFWQTFYTLYRTQQDKQIRQQEITKAIKMLRPQALRYFHELPITYKIMNLIYRIFPFYISDIINRKISVSNN